MDRVATRKDALGNIQSYQYDGNGNLVQYTDRRGKITSYTYDGLNRRVFAGYGTQAGPSYESTISSTYDSGNHLTQVVDSISGTITRTYDSIGHLTSETTPQGSISYTYDPGTGRRATKTVAGQPTVSYSYDSAGFLNQITQGSSTITLAHDSRRHRTSLTLANGVIISYTYDTASQLTGITYSKGGTVIGNFAYGYDAEGRRTTVTGSFARTGFPWRLRRAVTMPITNSRNGAP